MYSRIVATYLNVSQPITDVDTHDSNLVTKLAILIICYHISIPQPRGNRCKADIWDGCCEFLVNL